MPIQRVCHLMIGQHDGGLPANTFIFTVVTTGVDETFTLPLEISGSYNFNVEWGDSNSDNISVWDDAAKIHTYASAGTHEIKITGTLVGFRVNYYVDRQKIYELKQWGIVRLGNSDGYFQGCTNLTITATDVLNLTGTTNLQDAFAFCPSLVTVPSMNSWDVSSITNMHYMFNGATSFNQNIGNWNVSSVLDMFGMFNGAVAFNQDIGGWVPSSVTEMYSMFRNAASFNPDIGNWNVSSVLDMRYMFWGAASFNQDISGWNVSNVTTMWGMFLDAVSFDQNVGGWDITSIEHMDSMFDGVTLSTANYNAILIGFEGQAVQNNVPFHGGNSKYSAGAAATARQALIDDHSWIISDSGQV